jgi:hypothetical protein
VPLYLVYGAKGGEPAILPSILTEGVVVKASTPPPRPADASRSPTMIDRRVLLGLAAAAAVAAPAVAPPRARPAGPAFTAVDADGTARSLAEFRGKTVVLEWTNNGCPYVQKHYNSGHMQGLQKEATKDGVVWLTLISSAPGLPGLPDRPAGQAVEGQGGRRLLRRAAGPEGHGGPGLRAPGPRRTCTSSIRTGTLVYMGGIDDQPTPDPASLKGARTTSPPRSPT